VAVTCRGSRSAVTPPGKWNLLLYRSTTGFLVLDEDFGGGLAVVGWMAGTAREVIDGSWASLLGTSGCTWPLDGGGEGKASNEGSACGVDALLTTGSLAVVVAADDWISTITEASVLAFITSTSSKRRSDCTGGKNSDVAGVGWPLWSKAAGVGAESFDEDDGGFEAVAVVGAAVVLWISSAASSGGSVEGGVVECGVAFVVVGGDAVVAGDDGMISSAGLV